MLHWATAIAFIVSLFTGIRIAATRSCAPVSHWLDPILPQGEIWTWHFLAGLTLFFCASAYLIYMWRSGLANRNALKKTRVMVMPVARQDALRRPQRAAALGGLPDHRDHDGDRRASSISATAAGWCQVHSYAAFVGLGYIFVHVVAHYLFGGWWQVFRVFRPAQAGADRSGEAEAAADRGAASASS